MPTKETLFLLAPFAGLYWVVFVNIAVSETVRNELVYSAPFLKTAI